MNTNVLIKYPNKSHRKKIKIPKESANLAELIGIEFGDGGISNPWQVVVTLNAEKDEEYARFIKKLIFELFDISAVFRRRGKRTLQIIASSTSLVDFLIEKGAVQGDKIKQRFDIPNWIYGNNKYEKAFVRGLVDTDGCLYVHRHVSKSGTYENIGFCYTSYSRNLLRSVAIIFRKFKIEPHITDNGRRIYLYARPSVEKYLCTFGSNNPRISNLYKTWRGRIVV